MQTPRVSFSEAQGPASLTHPQTYTAFLCNMAPSPPPPTHTRVHTPSGPNHKRTWAADVQTLIPLRPPVRPGQRSHSTPNPPTPVLPPSGPRRGSAVARGVWRAAAKAKNVTTRIRLQWAERSGACCVGRTRSRRGPWGPCPRGRGGARDWMESGCKHSGGQSEANEHLANAPSRHHPPPPHAPPPAGLARPLPRGAARNVRPTRRAPSSGAKTGSPWRPQRRAAICHFGAFSTEQRRARPQPHFQKWARGCGCEGRRGFVGVWAARKLLCGTGMAWAPGEGGGGGVTEMGFCAGPFVLCKDGCCGKGAGTQILARKIFFTKKLSPHIYVVKMISATWGSF